MGLITDIKVKCMTNIAQNQREEMEVYSYKNLIL